jgi:hypothetical protein
MPSALPMSFIPRRVTLPPKLRPVRVATTPPLIYISSKIFSPKEPRDKKLLHRTSISMQNMNGLGTDAKIREAYKTVRENRIPCTIVLETPRCFDQCLEYGNITFLGHGSRNVKSRTKGVGVMPWVKASKLGRMLNATSTTEDPADFFRSDSSMRQ